MPDEMPDRRAAEALENFIGELRAAFDAAGPPTYARLETLSERRNSTEQNVMPRLVVLPHSTTHDIVTGKRRRLPPWRWVLSYVTVLGDAALENGLDPEAIGTIPQWRDRYMAAKKVIDAAAAPPPPPLPAPIPEALPDDSLELPGDDDHAPPTPSYSYSYPSDTRASDRLPTVDELLQRIQSDRELLARGFITSLYDAAAPGSTDQDQPADGLPRAPADLDGSYGDQDRRQPDPNRYGGFGETVPDRYGALWDLEPGDSWCDRDPLTAPPGGEHEHDPADERPVTEPPHGSTTEMLRYVNSYGRTGMRLLRQAEDDRDHGVPAYQLAVLLTCENRPEEAVYWLQRAARLGHPEAERLAAGWDPRTDRTPPAHWRPAQAAYEIGLEYEDADHRFAAAVFFKSAAEQGHADSAYRAGLHHMQLGRHWEAMLLYNRAVEAGYDAAWSELEALLVQYNPTMTSSTTVPRFPLPGFGFPPSIEFLPDPSQDPPCC